MTAPRRRSAKGLLVAALACVAACTGQSRPSGSAGTPGPAGAYLSGLAASDTQAGSLEQRRAVVARLNRAVLLAPPPDALVPELFDLTTQLASRVEAGEVSPNWAVYLYTVYQRDMLRDRPDGTPRRSSEEVRAQVSDYVEFFHITTRPDAPPNPLADFFGTPASTVVRPEDRENERLRSPHERSPRQP